jgi:hypothetical protein
MTEIYVVLEKKQWGRIHIIDNWKSTPALSA